MTTKSRYASRVLEGPAAQARTEPDEIVDVRRQLEPTMRISAAPDRTLYVLIADDCHDTTDSMSMLVRLWGHKAIGANCGATALALAVAERPDVLLLDVAMPGMDGYELARQIRRHASLDASLLVAVTGYADEHHRRLGRAAGFDHYLVKPVKPSTIEKLLLVEKGRRAQGYVTQARAP